MFVNSRCVFVLSRNPLLPITGQWVGFRALADSMARFTSGAFLRAGTKAWWGLLGCALCLNSNVQDRHSVALPLLQHRCAMLQLYRREMPIMQ